MNMEQIMQLTVEIPNPAKAIKGLKLESLGDLPVQSQKCEHNEHAD